MELEKKTYSLSKSTTSNITAVIPPSKEPNKIAINFLVFEALNISHSMSIFAFKAVTRDTIVQEKNHMNILESENSGTTILKKNNPNQKPTIPATNTKNFFIL